jgi:large subunit ribosomal protein L10
MPGEEADAIASNIRMQVVRTRMLDVALRVVDFFDPAAVKDNAYTHDLSKAANDAVNTALSAQPETGSADISPDSQPLYHQLSPLLVGPVALLTFPSVSPAHLAAALSILAPNPPAFPAPSRKKHPGYYEPIVQNALQKLFLVGGRIEGKPFDTDGVRWVGGIEGGLDSLRAQLVALLQSAGLGLTGALDGAARSLWLTMEGRKGMLEEEEKEKTP